MLFDWIETREEEETYATSHDTNDASSSIFQSDDCSDDVKDMSLLIIVLNHPFWDNRNANDNAISCLSDIHEIDSGFLKFCELLRLLVCSDYNSLRDDCDTIASLANLSTVVVSSWIL